jgi:hypothetical protein
MPDSPCCNEEMGFSLDGAVCPKCLTVYNPSAVKKMPGYDREWMQQALDFYMVLLHSGALRPGLNVVEECEDGLIIEHKPLA